MARPGAAQQVEQEQRFTFAVDDIEHTLRERMRAYEMVLRGLAGVVAGSDEVTADDWARAADQLQLQDFYPGIQAVALARYATPQTLPALIEQIHASGRERFRMYPSGERDEYVVTDYIHPTDWRNRRVLGFDLFSEATRREAIISSRDSGNPVLWVRCGSSRKPSRTYNLACCSFSAVRAIRSCNHGR